MSAEPEQRPVTSAGAILQLIRSGQAETRAELTELTGLSRSTIAQRIDWLQARGLVVAAGENASTGGRPSLRLAFNGDAGVIIAVDLGARHARLAISTLTGDVLIERAAAIEISDGPEAILGWATKQFGEMLDEVDRPRSDVLCVGVGLPGPVEFASGWPVSPPIMPGWDRFPVAGYLSEHFSAEVLVDNDVNLMAAGEEFLRGDGHDLVFVKVGTGIGLGIISDGQIQRGAQGCAGDIGHVRTSGHDDVLCMCGNRGCLEAVAGGGALAERLTAAGIPVADARELAEHARSGTPQAVHLLREAGRELGAVLASVVNLLNPGSLIVGGEVAEAGEHLLAGIRENVYRRSTPLATHTLIIGRSAAGERAGVIGATALCIEHVMSPAAVERRLNAVV